MKGNKIKERLPALWEVLASGKDANFKKCQRGTLAKQIFLLYLLLSRDLHIPSILLNIPFCIITRSLFPLLYMMISNIL